MFRVYLQYMWLLHHVNGVEGIREQDYNKNNNNNRMERKMRDQNMWLIKFITPNVVLVYNIDIETIKGAKWRNNVPNNFCWKLIHAYERLHRQTPEYFYGFFGDFSKFREKSEYLSTLCCCVSFFSKLNWM